MKQLTKEDRPFHLMSLDFIKTVDVNANQAPYHYITVFKRNREDMRDKSADAYRSLGEQFRNDSAEIDRYITERKFNYASIILEDHFIILTEQPLGFNPLMVKLTTGVDLKGEFEFNFAEWIRHEGAADLYPKLLRE